MELNDKEIQLLAQKLGLLQWFDARSSTTPFKEHLRAFLRLHGISGRIDYAWVAAVENRRELVGPEVSAKVDAIDQVKRAVNSRPFRAGRGRTDRRLSGRRLNRRADRRITGRTGSSSPGIRRNRCHSIIIPHWPGNTTIPIA